MSFKDFASRAEERNDRLVADTRKGTGAVDTPSASDADGIGTASAPVVPPSISGDAASPVSGTESRRRRGPCERYRMEISIPVSVRRELEETSARTGVPMSSLLVQAWYGKSLRDEA